MTPHREPQRVPFLVVLIASLVLGTLAVPLLAAGMLLLQRGWRLPELWLAFAVLATAAAAIVIRAPRRRASIAGAMVCCVLELVTIVPPHRETNKFTWSAVRSDFALLSRDDLERGKLPQDPFLRPARGKFRVRLTAAGWQVWSVGPDGVDDGGRPVDARAAVVGDWPLQIMPWFASRYWRTAWPGDVVAQMR